MFLRIWKLTGSANVGKVLPLKLTSYSTLQVINFYSSLFCKVLGEKKKNLEQGNFGEHRLEVILETVISQLVYC